MPRAGFPYGHFVDLKCLRTGPRGFLRKWFFKGICFQARREKARVYCKRGGARGIRAFEQQSIKANTEEKICPVRDSNPNHRFRRPVLYPVELTGRKKAKKSKESKNDRIYSSIFRAPVTVSFLISKGPIKK